ncbi:hypothetical protein [Enterococcus mundtii]|uniref:hypothetical protein n=1 Tax=Enterococcus mundtii TaxID=53346 RepID=UPI000825EF4C|nr:hypothetical protein [Enterococcus mundtii]
MSKSIDRRIELEEFWMQLEQDFFGRIDSAIYKSKIDKEKKADEIHLAKLEVERIIEHRFSKLKDKFLYETLTCQDVRQYFNKAERSYRKPINDFITKCLNDGDIWN